MNIRAVKSGGELLRKRRLERGLSQEALARVAGISRHHLGNIENGAGASIRTLKRLADALESPELMTEIFMQQVRAVEAAAGLTTDGLAAARVAAISGIRTALRERSTILDLGAAPLNDAPLHVAYRDGQPLEPITGGVALPAILAIPPGAVLIRVDDESMRSLGAAHGSILIAERLHRPTIETAAPVLLEVLSPGIHLGDALAAELPTGRVFVGYMTTEPDGTLTLRRGSHRMNLSGLRGPYHTPFVITAIYRPTTGGNHVER